MSKQYNIRWSESDNDQLRKAVKNFNAKISRLEKKNPKMKNALPEKVSVKQMKELIDTRQDLKRELNALKRFSRKGAEELVDVPDNKYNLQITKWQKNEMTRRVAVINRKRKKRYEDVSVIEVKSRGEGQGYTVGQLGMGRTDEVALRPMKVFTPKMDRTDLKMKYKALQKESREMYWQEKQLRLKQNVINGLYANYNAEEFIHDIHEIVEAIENMDFNEFYTRFMSERGVMEIVSPPPGSNAMDMMRNNVEALKSTWIPNEKEG